VLEPSLEQPDRRAGELAERLGDALDRRRDRPGGDRVRVAERLVGALRVGAARAGGGVGCEGRDVGEVEIVVDTLRAAIEAAA